MSRFVSKASAFKLKPKAEALEHKL